MRLKGQRLTVTFLSAAANLQTGVGRRLIEGTSGLIATFFTKVKGIFSKTASLELTGDGHPS